jgi:hypothetical protein
MTTTRSPGRGPNRGVDSGEDRVLRIDCAECVLEGTSACVDCVVTFLVDREPGTPVLVDAAEARTLGALARGGLAPVLRHRPGQPA